jgi:hypothetical protein
VVDLRFAVTSQNTRESDDVVTVKVIAVNEGACACQSHAITPRGAVSMEGVQVKYVPLGKRHCRCEWRSTDTVASSPNESGMV